ncbi:MAG: hypothetical protein ACI4AB_04270 [Acetatifactor sp.]
MLSSFSDLISDTENRVLNGIPIEVEQEVERQIEQEHHNLPKDPGYCHTFWARKKELLKERGYNWTSPLEQNKHILYD